ncbi:hypothetical protein EG68_07405 [Paragonimus skrjabini miyazakii]|uniref:DUF4455 domain-containing protein n=1 Tax=Paragonimus skrjabini miyazakii TaxID=59628 RepID=A0A8S9YK73_9TREM|nr:hypothetical protein EG68_07405 [Paragonimus skrjabini miyazakii]
MSDYLGKNSHLSPSELHVVLLEEIRRVNMDLLMNQREIASLLRNLRLLEVVNHRKSKFTWNHYREKWQQFNANYCLEEFKTSMTKKDVRLPETVNILIEELSTEHRTFYLEEENLFEEICERTIPPNFTSEVLNSWIQRAKHLFMLWEKKRQLYLQSIYSAYEDHSQKCIDRLKELQVHLLEFGYLDSVEEAGKLLGQHCIPILGNLQKQFEKNLNYLDCCFAWAANANDIALANPIYRFGETLLGFWEEFGVKPMKLCQQTLTSRLLTERQHETDHVKQKDVALNLAIDSLRQSATDDQVTDRLHEVLRLLDLIKNM